jgi:hypothetical protein
VLTFPPEEISCILLSKELFSLNSTWLFSAQSQQESLGLLTSGNKCLIVGFCVSNLAFHLHVLVVAVDGHFAALTSCDVGVGRRVDLRRDGLQRLQRLLVGPKLFTPF